MNKLKRLLLFFILPLLLLIFGSFLSIRKYLSSPDRIANFIAKNPDRSAVLITKNDTVIYRLNPDTPKPLASTMKTIILLEYCRQVTEGVLNKYEQIDIEEIALYYVDKTDGGAHKQWIEGLNKDKRINENKVVLEEVAKGMILYSSNACTEYLTEKVGLENINNSLSQIGAKQHEKLFYVVSYLFLPQEVGYEKAKMMSNEEILEQTKIIHEKLKHKQIKYDEKLHGEKEEELFSTQFVKATVNDYVAILKNVYADTVKNNEIIKQLDQIFSTVTNKNTWAKHIYMKGGSTLFILTNSFYIEDEKGNKYSVAYFFYPLNFKEYFTMQMAFNNFNLAILGRGVDFNKLLVKMNRKN